jgi:molecular chaperone DnaK
LSEDEIEQMVRDAETNAEADKKFEALVVARNTAEGLANATRKTLEEAGDKASDEEKAAIESALTEVDEALKGDDIEVIEAATKKLTEASGGLAEKMYAEQAAQAQAEGGAEEAQAGGSADDVVDAEFEEVKDDDKK